MAAHRRDGGRRAGPDRPECWARRPASRETLSMAACCRGPGCISWGTTMATRCAFYIDWGTIRPGSRRVRPRGNVLEAGFRCVPHASRHPDGLACDLPRPPGTFAVTVVAPRRISPRSWSSFVIDSPGRRARFRVGPRLNRIFEPPSAIIRDLRDPVSSKGLIRQGGLPPA